MTSGEGQFESFCLKYGFAYRPVHKDPDFKTPDYELFPNSTPIIIEVKDLTHNREELRAIDDITSKGFAVWGSSRVGNRIREKIRSAHLQLKKQSNQTPTILLIFDDRREYVSVLSPYEIAVGMYGYETRVLNVDRSVSRHFGRDAQMTSTSRQYISAVGILTANWYTTRPLPSNPLTKCPAVTIFKLPHEPRTIFDDWIEMRDINE